MTDERPSATRRGVLRAAGAAAVAGTAGCVGGTIGGAGRGDRTSRSTTVAVLAAGSLQHALESGLGPAVDVPVEVEAHGSATVARLVAEGQRDPDIVTVADTALFSRPLSPPWHSVFTSNAVVLAYNPETEGGDRIEETGDDRWYEPLLEGDVSLGRTDPDQDPLGYRTLFALELASRYYDDAPDLVERIPRRDQVYPETSLISRFETGSIDAAFAYRNMAVERGYEYVDLPEEIDLSNPDHADDWYSTASYTLPGDREIRGGPIAYGSTIRKPSDAAASVFDVLTTGDYLAESGFVLRDEFPTYEGAVPDRVREATGRSEANTAVEGAPIRSLSETVSDVTVPI